MGQEPVNDGNHVEQEVPVEAPDDRQGRTDCQRRIVFIKQGEWIAMQGIPSGNLTKLLNMVIYGEFSH